MTASASIVTPPSTTRPAGPGAVVTLGFAAAVAMWAIGYVCMMRPGLILGEVLFVLMGGALVAAGFLGGRLAGHGWKQGLGVGAVASTINLLLVGALITDPRFAAHAAIWVVGVYGGSMALTTLGAALGRRAFDPDRPGVNWYGWLLVAASATIFLLLITGGIVTGHEAGLAVPDWPNSFGHNMFLYPLQEMTDGVYYEHAHRLYGALVGLGAILVLITAWRCDSRGWVKGLATVAFLLVCLQGTLGGFRVTELSVPLAIMHGVLGQIVFALFVCLAACTSSLWRSDTPPRVHGSSGLSINASMVLMVLFVIQLAIGASFRHLHTGGEMTGPALTGLVHLHLIFAVVVFGGVMFVGFRSWGLYPELAPLRRLGVILLALTTFQMVLGFAAFIVVPVEGVAADRAIPLLEIIVTSVHQATGALLLASAAALHTWSRRLLAPDPVRQAAAAASPAGG